MVIAVMPVWRLTRADSDNLKTAKNAKNAKAANTAKGDMWQCWQPWQPCWSETDQPLRVVYYIQRFAPLRAAMAMMGNARRVVMIAPCP
jgi:hypothetical protein